MIEIQNWRDQPTADGKNVLALFDVYLPKISLTLREFKIIKSKKGGFFVKGPSFRIQTREDATAWLPYFAFNGEREKQFYEEIYQLIKDNVKV